MTQTQGSSGQGMEDTENDYPSLVFSCTHRISPPQAALPATGLQPCLSQVSGLPGSYHTSQHEALLQRGPLSPSPERCIGHGEGSCVTLVPTATMSSIHTWQRSPDHWFLLRRSPVSVILQRVGGTKAVWGGVHVNTTMVRLGAQVYVCLHSVWRREVGITVLCVLGGPIPPSLCLHW